MIIRRMYWQTGRELPRLHVALDHSSEFVLQTLRRTEPDADTWLPFRYAVHEAWGHEALSRMTDDEVVRRAACLLATEHLLLAPGPLRRWDLGGTIVEKTSEAPAPSPARASPREEAPEPNTFDANHDGPRQAAVLATAARNGTPFCEACAKALAESTGGDSV